MNDSFAELGLPRRFDLDDASLRAAAQQSGDSAAYQMIADPRQRAETLLTLMNGPTRQQWLGLPPDFEAALAAAGSDPQKRAALAQQRLDNISHLFRQLGSNDKGTVQAGRQRMIRSELNALDALASPIASPTASPTPGTLGH
jgi:hypothetical protein